MTDSLKRTPLYEAHKSLGARLVPFAGWEMPVQYKNLVEEHVAVRTAAGLFDVSHMGQLHISGKDAEAVIQQIVTNNVKRLAIGKAFYAVACNEQGGIHDDLIVYREGDWEFRIICNAGNREKIAGIVARASQDRCEFVDQSDERALLALQGPYAKDIIIKLERGEALAELPSFGCVETQLDGISVFAARTGYTGEDGFEISCKTSDADKLWNLLLKAGEPAGLKPAGLGARDTLRLEAALCLYGNDIDEKTDPLEAGLGWVVKLEKGPFTGRDALLEKKQHPSARKLVGLEMVGRGIARAGYTVLSDGQAHIGIVTSGSPSPTLGKNIALAYVPREFAEPGTGVAVEIRGQAVEAQVVKTPFYKRQK